MSDYIAKIGFLFVAFVVVSGGYVTQTMPCQTQKYFRDSTVAKHLIGILMCFLFIMLEGGWSFNQSVQDKATVDWASGNALDTMAFAFLLYATFLVSAKMELKHNLVLYAGLLLLYITNSQRLYWHNRQMISDDTDATMTIILQILSVVCIVFAVIGVIRYFIKQRREKEGKFEYVKFFLDAGNCNTDTHTIEENDTDYN
jgi:hypothetical protein